MLGLVLSLLAGGPIAAAHAEALLLIAAQDPQRSDRLRATIATLTESAPFSVTIRNHDFAREAVLDGSSQSGLAAAAWIDLRDASEGWLYFLAPGSEQAAIRRFDGTVGDALLFEQLGQTYRTLLDAVAQGTAIGKQVSEVRRELGLSAPATPSPAAPAPAPAAVVNPAALVASKPQAAPWVHLDGSVLYGVGRVSAAVPVQQTLRAGLVATMGRGRIRFGFAAAVARALASTLTLAPTLDGQLDAWTVHAGPALQGLAGANRIELGMDFGASFVRLDATPASASPFVARRAARRPAYVLFPRLRVARVVVRSLAAFLQLGAAVELSDLSFTIKEGGQARTALDPARIQPELALGISY